MHEGTFWRATAMSARRRTTWRLCLALGVVVAFGDPSAEQRDAPTFSRDVAPIIFEHCSGCHRPGAIAPFSLQTFPEVRQRARQIAEAVTSGYMPPWLPGPDSPPFVGARRLSAAEVSTIDAWVAAGGVEGDPADLPPMSSFPDSWELGEPDLVVGLAAPYSVPAAGLDRFRNFVLPLPLDAPRYIRGIELEPDNRAVLHHATLLADTTGTAAELDDADAEAGYAGMEGGVPPGGHFVGWAPGRRASPFEEGLEWEALPGTDLILQLHTVPIGRPETLQPAVGLYFTEDAPTAVPVMIHLGSRTIDLAAGATAHAVRDEFVVPVDVEVLKLFPHAHYLAREMRGIAVLPDGTTETLLQIDHWDFNWQDEYRFVEPLVLPAGTRLQMEFRYDNSTANQRDPNRPPQRVRWGPRTVDAMGDLWIKAVAPEPIARATLQHDVDQHNRNMMKAGYRSTLTHTPVDFIAHSRLGHLLVEEGRWADAQPHLMAALRQRPGAWGVHHNLGVALASEGDLAAAIREFEAALAGNPRYPAAHASLATTLVLSGRPVEAVEHYRDALALRPGDADVSNNLGFVLARLGQYAEAEQHYRDALARRPDFPEAQANLATTLLRLGRTDDGVRALTRAVELRPNDTRLRVQLGRLLAQTGRPHEARVHLREAVRLEPGNAEASAALVSLDAAPPP